MARRIALLLLFAVPSLVAAQTFTVTESGNDTDGTINIAECQGNSGNFTLTWTITSYTTAGTYAVWVSNETFGTTTGTTCSTMVTSGATYGQLSGTVTASSATGTYPTSGTVSAQTIMTQAGLSACSGTATAVNVCVDYTPSGGTTKEVLTGTINVDFSIPSAPTGVAVTPGDSHMTANWSAVGSSGTTSGYVSGYMVYWGPHNGTLSQSAKVTSQGTTSYDITGLSNDAIYDVQVATLSGGGNLSDRSAIASGSPAMVYDFWRLYQYDGGTEKGGCATGAAGLAALLGLVPLALRRRKRRRS